MEPTTDTALEGSADAGDPGAPGSAGASSLGGVARGLRSARSSEERLRGARTLVETARHQCAHNAEIGALVEAAQALLAALKAESPETDRSGKPDLQAGPSRALAAVAHDFIDLARLNPVRRAAYPAEKGQPGGEWLDLVIEIIDRTDFTVGRMFRQRAAQYPQKTLFIVPRGELVTEYSWEHVARETERIARGVLALLGPEAAVAIFTPNRVEGALIDLACLTNGIFNTMVPVNVVASQLRHILVESGAKMLVVSGAEQLQKARGALESLPSLEWVVTLDPPPAVVDDDVLTLNQLLERAEDVSSDTLQKRVARVGSHHIATTMYTSGTTGAPKGIKFSHLNLVSKRFARISALPDIDENEVFLCYLPLYHTFGRYLEMLASVHLAATYIFAENASTETLLQHMRRFSPTAMISVPKKWLDVYRRVVGGNEPPDDPEQAQRALKELTGGRLRWGLSAAGRLDSEIFRFFEQHGINLVSGYGMTEAVGGITMTPVGKYVDDSIGKALPGIELGFADDNELLLRGPYVTSGYTDEQDDVAGFRDGWFCTGDIVSRDAAGYLKHVDRKKDIYKNASGRTIAPQRVEGLFTDFPEVRRVFAVADGREYVTLLIRPNMDHSEVAFAEVSDAVLREYFRGLVVSCNRFLAPFERVVKFALIDRDFSLERGELTPKGSFRRAVVCEHFRDVIEPMYASSTIERVVDGLRVKIPIAFLQHLGATEAGTEAVDDGLAFRGAGKKLPIRCDPDVADRVWIGNCCYDAVDKVIDLDDWLRLPDLWVGNAHLTHITGESILHWSLSGHDRATPSKMVGVEPADVPIDAWEARLAGPRDATPGLLTVHAAAVALSGGGEDAGLRAVDYLAHAMTTGRVHLQELIEAQLQLAAHHGSEAVRSRAFVALYEHQPAESFGKTASMFCGSQVGFLDDQACREVARIGIKAEPWRHLRRAFASLRRSIAHAGSTRAQDCAISLLRSLGRIAEMREDFYLPVRREMMRWILAPVSESLRGRATETAEALIASFRQGLFRHSQGVTPHRPGVETPRQEDGSVAEPEPACTWRETIQFEDGIDPGELSRIASAIEQTDLVREAVYVLHQRREIDLVDLTPESIWISLIATRFGRSMYHVAVRLRSRERYDLMLYVRGSASTEAMLTDLRLMCVAAGDPGDAPLTSHFGGYWPQYGIATIEYIPRESLETLVRHMHEHPDREVRQHLKNAWRHLSWSALTAVFEFFRRTEGRWMLTGTVGRVITVPLNDFDKTTQIFSAALLARFGGPLDMILRLKRAFIDRVRFHFPALAPETQDEMVFAGAVEALGVREGVILLNGAIAQAQGMSAPTGEIIRLCEKMRAYVRQVQQGGYMPKALCFAIARYHTWSKEVPDAGVQARAAQLRELQNVYSLDAVARKFPGSRLWLYAETVLKDSPPEGRQTIERAIQRLREGDDIKDVLGRLYSDLQEKLPSSDQQYFLTRAAYPHLELDENAELVTTSEDGPERAELVTLHTDRTRRELRIRPVANSRELDTLHRIFYSGGIGGMLTSHEKFLVVVDQARYVVGGVGYIHRTSSHVILDKIAVLPRCRGRGIGRILMQDFLRRQTAEGVTIVSAQFIRASWLAQFGFKSHPRYAGVVLPLA